jgi:hypothetical protein
MAGPLTVLELTFHRRAGVSCGDALRAYDPNTELWSIWSVDRRDAHRPLGPPVTSRFDGGVGTF